MTSRRTTRPLSPWLAAGAIAASSLAAGCSAPPSRAAEPAAAAAAPIEVATARVAEETVTRVVRATGTLMADDQAEVSAEIAGRIAATPVERGTRVADGATLVQLASTEASAQLAEAEAIAAQAAAALNLDAGGAFDVARVPEVANARAELQLAEAEYARVKSLLDQRVVSPSEHDQRATQVEAARQRLEAARNAATQRFRGYQASLARVTLARKALADTTVRAPFAGAVVERRVSVGDYVTRGQVVAVVVRMNPLRVELAIPEQDVSRVAAGQPVTFRVDAHSDRVFTGTVRFVAPALRTDQRALTIEAVVANADGALKPGLFATAEIAEPGGRKALLVPRVALREVGSTQRLFVIAGDRLEDRIVAPGQTVGDRVVLESGVRAGELVAIPGAAALAEGTLVKAR